MKKVIVAIIVIFMAIVFTNDSFAAARTYKKSSIREEKIKPFNTIMIKKVNGTIENIPPDEFSAMYEQENSDVCLQLHPSSLPYRQDDLVLYGTIKQPLLSPFSVSPSTNLDQEGTAVMYGKDKNEPKGIYLVVWLQYQTNYGYPHLMGALIDNII